MNPWVTCIQTSYGRPHLSEEAVECFARQTYQNKKLVIVNTHRSRVGFEPGYAEVRNISVVNCRPFPYLSDVYRFAMDQVTTPLFCLWDDDDLFLPWHIDDRVKLWLEVKDHHPRKPVRVGNSKSIFANGPRFLKQDSNMFVAQYLYEASSLRPPAGEPVWDLEWERLWETRGTETVRLGPSSRPSYVYRWGTGEDHISSKPDPEGQHQNYLANIARKNAKVLPGVWHPHWDHDYVAKADELFANEMSST